MSIPSALLKRSVFTAKIGTVFEKMRTFSGITTVIRATAKTIDIPGLTVDAANNHSIKDQNTIGSATPSTSTLTIDVKTDKSIDYSEEDYRDDMVGFKKLTQDEILRVITTKVNKNFTDAVLAAATAQAGTIALDTNDKVNDFLSGIAVDAGEVYFSWKPAVEHGQTVRAKYQGKGFALAGSNAYKRLLSANSSIRFQSTTEATVAQDIWFMSPQGVVVINVGSAFASLNQIVWGIGGAPLHAYRSDKIQEWDIAVNSRTTAAADSGDVTSGDAMLQRDRNMGAEIWNKATVPTQLASYIKKQVMA